jgi:hypothetical protein
MNRNPYPKVRRTSPARTQDSIAKVPLRELFWSVSVTCSLLEEAEQRIAAALRRSLTPEPVQLFDDLYEDLAC